MKLRLLELGTKCTDTATGLKGTLTHWVYDMSGSIYYLFQPKGLDDKGQPVKKLFLSKERLKVSKDDYIEIEIPADILGTQVTDEASGFKGMAVELVMHINGCFHVQIQPEGIVPDTKLPIDKCEFDLRGCVGEKIPKLTKEQRRKSIREDPSPAGDVPPRNLPSHASRILSGRH